MRIALIALVLGATGPAHGDSMVATHTIRAQTVLTAEDFTLVQAEIVGALTDPALAIGMEALVTLYAGRPIKADDLGLATVVERNQTVTLVYRTGGLSILTEGRALSRGRPGDLIKVMNLASRATVMGTVGQDGMVDVNAMNEG